VLIAAPPLRVLEPPVPPLRVGFMDPPSVPAPASSPPARPTPSQVQQQYQPHQKLPPPPCPLLIRKTFYPPITNSFPWHRAQVPRPPLHRHNCTRSHPPLHPLN
jgi:hypothetical protein